MSGEGGKGIMALDMNDKCDMLQDAIGQVYYLIKVYRLKLVWKH